MNFDKIDDEYEWALEQMLQSHNCPYLEVCDQVILDQCYNHSHVLCEQFREFYKPKHLYTRNT